MTSGDFANPVDDKTWQANLAELQGRTYTQVTFSKRPALLSKKPVNGHRMWKDYHGGPYDEDAFDLVQDMWDHEHCSVCYFKILDGHTYWESEKRIKLLCDACHERWKAES